MTGLSGISGAQSVAGSGDTSSRIAALMKQITKLVASLKDISQDTSMDEQAKKQQVALIQARIQMLQAQIEQLQKQDADKAQEKDMAQSQQAVTEPTSVVVKQNWPRL